MPAKNIGNRDNAPEDWQDSVYVMITATGRLPCGESRYLRSLSESSEDDVRRAIRLAVAKRFGNVAS